MCVCMCVCMVVGVVGAGLREGVQTKTQPQIGSCKLHVNNSKGALINFHDFKFCTFSFQFLVSLTFK